MREYDKNGDGAIDKNELENGRWSGNPYDYDLDGDGRLNKIEMAERYADRYGNSLGSQSNSSNGGSSSSSTLSSSGSSSGGSSQDKLKSYAQSLLRQYDANKNGSLDSDEFSKMPKPERYNQNGDNVITFDELLRGASNFGKSSSYGSSQSSSGGSRLVASGTSSDYRVTTAEDRLRKLGVPHSFILDDENQDGQLQMAEFSSTWTDAKIEEFQKYDLNGDWLITPEEWLEAEKLERAKKK